MDDLSREELFAMFKIDVDKVTAMSRSEEELEKLLNFVEQGLRTVADLIDETPSFSAIWEMKSRALPYTIAASEIEDKHDMDEKNIYKHFTNQLSSDVTFVVWLALSSSIVVARYLATTQFLFGDKLKEGTDKTWYMEKMTMYYEEILRPQFENITKFMTSLNFNDSNQDMNDQGVYLTEQLWDDELKESIINLSPIYLQAMEKVFVKISSLYIESLVMGEDNL